MTHLNIYYVGLYDEFLSFAFVKLCTPSLESLMFTVVFNYCNAKLKRFALLDNFQMWRPKNECFLPRLWTSKNVNKIIFVCPQSIDYYEKKRKMYCGKRVTRNTSPQTKVFRLELSWLLGWRQYVAGMCLRPTPLLAIELAFIILFLTA